MTTNIHAVQSTRRDWPAWYQRAKIRKVDAKGNILEGGFAANGEVVAVSPRYQKAGVNYRIRPERPAAFFAAWCHDNGLLPDLLTTDECQEEWALALLDPLWSKNRYRFPQLASPYAACDAATVPSHRVGFSFNILQVLIDHLDSVRSPGKTTTFRPSTNGHSNGADLEAARSVIEAMRARAKSSPPPSPASDDEAAEARLREMLASQAAPVPVKVATETTTVATPESAPDSTGKETAVAEEPIGEPEAPPAPEPARGNKAKKGAKP